MRLTCVRHRESHVETRQTGDQASPPLLLQTEVRQAAAGLTRQSDKAARKERIPMWPLVQAGCSYKICQVTWRNVGETLHITHWSESARPLCAVVHFKPQ